MKDYLVKDPWKIIEDRFHPDCNKITESIMSIGNGFMGQRANFEEHYSGETMQGSYLAGIYYPDKTRVGWWKNGYPEYFAKVLNSVNWIGLDVYLNGERLDLNEVKILDFKRVLDMRHSLLQKTIKLQTGSDHILTIRSERFCSWSTKELGCIQYSIESENFNGEIEIDSYLDFDVHNEDANYDEQFWEHVDDGVQDIFPYVQAYTKKTNFEVRALMHSSVKSDNDVESSSYNANKKAGIRYKSVLSAGQSVYLVKKAIIVSSFHVDKKALTSTATELMTSVMDQEYSVLKEKHNAGWDNIWAESDIQIEGDVSAQQGIRFNIFHLHQTYSGDDPRLNIGPKGFTGEKYGGSTYWDTEAYCLPFYLANSEQSVARNLLMYRYKHLDRAIENAAKLGFDKGAALYPMVTMNGEECHNEWEITFEEIHRNGAIAYAVKDYTDYTGDDTYLYDEGLEVLTGISRFWAQRVNWSEDKNAYVMLGVTGPNEYENNVNNNWYTNYIACWCMKYTMSTLEALSQKDKDLYDQKTQKLELDSSELDNWKDIVSKMYFPFDQKRGVYLQQDGFLDKELIPVSELEEGHMPLNQNWSWDRILRSCYIKQADVLQGIYLFEDDFTFDEIKANFDFYEPLTVHESSLSPCVHAILACRIGNHAKAYEMYLRTARLDLDDYNNDTEDGLHITSMAGTWMSVVKGFAGMKVSEDTLSFDPFIPKEWSSYSFKVNFRNRTIKLVVSHSNTSISLLKGDDIGIKIGNERYDITTDNTLLINNK